MRIGDPVDARLPWVRKLNDLNDAWGVSSSGPRLRAVRAAAERLGDAFRSGPKVAAVRTLPITNLPYPTSFAFNRAVPLPIPFVLMHHRCLLVQVATEDGVKNVLFNPTDWEASAETPFFKQLREGPGGGLAETLIRQDPPLLEQLRGLGLRAEDIDVVAFDHFHTQDLRPLLGSEVPLPDGSTMAARFPNAYLLAPRPEWIDWDDLHPLQSAWFIAEGKRGLPASRVILTDDDLWLGPGCVLMRTPGHTSGNQTLFAHGRHGVFGTSENGCSADSWAPYESTIPGLRAYARRYDAEVVLNSNTPELGAQQYTSMILEKTLADRTPSAPEFVQMFPSSEVTPWFLAPGIKPAMIFERMDHGVIVRRR
jgi:hypothetical protein